MKTPPQNPEPDYSYCVAIRLKLPPALAAGDLPLNRIATFFLADAMILSLGENYLYGGGKGPIENAFFGFEVRELQPFVAAMETLLARCRMREFAGIYCYDPREDFYRSLGSISEALKADMLTVDEFKKQIAQHRACKAALLDLLKQSLPPQEPPSGNPS